MCIRDRSYTGLRLVTEYYDMHGVLREAFVPFNSEFYASIGLPNDCVSVLGFRVRLLKASLPASGTYKMSVRFGSNTGLEYYDCYVKMCIRDRYNVLVAMELY